MNRNKCRAGNRYRGYASRRERLVWIVIDGICHWSLASEQQCRRDQPQSHQARTSILIGPVAEPWMNWSTKAFWLAAISADGPSQMILPL